MSIHPSGTGVLAHDIEVPQGFSCRVVARSGQPIGGTSWHPAPDGGACFADGDGWIYVSNSDVPLAGGASAIRFGPDGEVKDAYRILAGTSLNHTGVVTPWDSWLSCEDIFLGRVHEADPHGDRTAVAREAMGRFKHGHLAVDADRRVVYLTESEPDGCLYRFTPWTWGDLSHGLLEVLCANGASVEWRSVPDPAPGFLDVPTRYQTDTAVRFEGGGACHYAEGVCRFVTADGTWVYDAAQETLYRWSGPDEDLGGDILVTDLGDWLEIDLVAAGETTAVVRVEGHRDSEITGVAFSPDGSRLYFSSQRGTHGDSRDGVTFEVTGPFRH
ncbi:alkaline phosphatase PhoX [Stackebrandtia nassauensis]|uniref:WD40 domain protein beta Propeller n=1 Tax=Stackebrandtia nassauensis (strain DSM 44728 / CIP 108903 / NRRL B-16338 / NBRC 102104 / LLR-40K-21) TaxID=446470 RepID=D3Q4E9_STANL|nr:alkaline phosphatase PhoX [Stackebrandtia nassauensis]ADD40109.1 protein of unknown function DUF839 [Stackebrandtia nassauensis DSM 44728]